MSMDDSYSKPKLAKLKEGIEHQGIGGKYIVLEREDTLDYVLDIPINEMTIGLVNLVKRRADLFDIPEDTKVYYGHINSLGYFILEDEINGEIKEVDWNEAIKYL
jgi:hypothetical protein